uniref:Uncharacterized protein n=1 Tax=Trichobilharzia regenti TaxID=157069 RepID=A0AA85IVY0_TRIRE|nr:unnamed protein product [Trichobilharzia regenti]
MNNFENAYIRRQTLLQFLINMTLMILVTVGLVILFSFVPSITRFFMEHSYLAYIIMSVATIPLLLVTLVREIRLNFFAVHILIWVMVISWSVIVAAVYSPVDLKYGLIALAVTILFTLGVVLVAMKLPQLSEKGFNVLLAISAVLGVLAVVVRISCYSMNKLKEGLIFCKLLAVPVVLFIHSVMFICVNVRRWIMWWFTPNTIDVILASIIWCHMISLFAQIYSSLI